MIGPGVQGFRCWLVRFGERRECVCSSVHAKPSTPSLSFDQTPQTAWTDALNLKCWCLTASGHWGRHACHRPILQERRGVGLTVTTREVGFGLRVWATLGVKGLGLLPWAMLFRTTTPSRHRTEPKPGTVQLAFSFAMLDANGGRIPDERCRLPTVYSVRSIGPCRISSMH